MPPAFRGPQSPERKPRNRNVNKGARSRRPFQTIFTLPRRPARRPPALRGWSPGSTLEAAEFTQVFRQNSGLPIPPANAGGQREESGDTAIRSLTVIFEVRALGGKVDGRRRSHSPLPVALLFAPADPRVAPLHRRARAGRSPARRPAKHCHTPRLHLAPSDPEVAPHQAEDQPQPRAHLN